MDACSGGRCLRYATLNTMLPLLATVAVHAATLALGFLADDAIRPFNGKTLEGWDGDKSYWSVEDGQIVGRSTPEHPLPKSTYLVWTGNMPGDFDLRCKVKLQGGNSGIQYRSRRVQGQADMAGFQADLDANDSYTGVLYEGLGRELMSARGEQVEWSPAGKRVVAQFAPDATLRAAIRRDDWNDYRIEARGTRVRHWINGTLMSDVTDGDASRFRSNGQMGLQLHQGAPMEVRFKDFQVRPLTSAPPASALIAPEGFTVELLTSAQPGQGSWVCMTFDPLGRAVISPQTGPLMQAWIPGISRMQNGQPWDGREVMVKALEEQGEGRPSPPLASAQGLCFLDGALFVNVSQGGGQNGLWRLRDTNNDGSYDERTRLFEYHNEGGEHGPHAVIPGPDGMLWMTLGNHTQIPDGIVLPEPDATGRRAPGSAYDHWGEDMATPRMWDPRGHAVGIVAPGGVVLRIDPKTGAATMFAAGFRNAYDLCFNGDGELFTYDSDMEWDIGAPWYRAPRVVHVVNGAEYGWRSGSGNWPDWYADSLPPACDTDVASPTGMLSGSDGKLPEPWKSALFAADWTYGRILSVELKPDGSSYRANWRPFLTGRPMPVTDMAWGPDGAMYMTTGGRGTQSGLYRISYTGKAPIAAKPAATDRAAARARAGRRAFEAMQKPLAAEEYAATATAIDAAMSSPDRFLASAARVAMEQQPVEAWRSRVGEMQDPRGAATAALALVRCGNDADAQAACAILAGILGAGSNAGNAAAPADPEVTLIALRAAQVAMVRHGAIAQSAPMQAIATRAIALGASPDPRIAQAAMELACALGRAEAVPVALNCLEHAPDRATAMRYASILRTVDAGWDDALRQRYWAWLDAANDRAGGMSLSGFLEAIRKDAMEHVHRPSTQANSGAKPAVAAGAAAAPRPSTTSSATAHAWTVAELTDDTSTTHDLARGAALFRESSCILCHRFAGEGAGTGPDLTGVGARFSRADLLRAILEPSAFVSDQYRDSAVETKDGGMMIGRIVADEKEYLEVLTNPLSPDRERVPKSEVTKITVVETSSMPKGLMDMRTRAEIMDLVAYLESGGRAK